MARWLKEGLSQEEKDTEDNKVRRIVEEILNDIKTNGDLALRKYSKKFDNWSPNKFRLSQSEIDACYKAITEQNINDIKFAQAQVRKFAKIQKSALVDVEEETYPGVTLGHKNIPVNSVGCYVPGGKYPMVA